MISFHFQESPQGWPLSVAKLPSNAAVKFVFAAERARESKGVNSKVKTWYRWLGHQPLPHDNFEQHCRNWLNQFIDETFIRNNAEHINYIQEYNETLANSQDAAEKARWIELHSTMARLWHDEYRYLILKDGSMPLAHIRMILCETAIGNDIPWEIAKAAQRYNALLGWHPYTVCRVGTIVMSALNASKAGTFRYDAPRASFREDTSLYPMEKSLDITSTSRRAIVSVPVSAINVPEYVSPHDWRWYSGRWATMDAEYVARGIHVDWAFGEGGPVLDASINWSGWLDPLGGWKNKDCLNGDFNKYLEVMKYWLDNTTQTLA